MTIQIDNILIWQKNGNLRNLELDRNSVNVITGESGKGKSSILHIIDYCLLASTADGISKSNIDDKSRWYGLRLHTSSGPIVIAREAYHVRETGKVYFSEGDEIPKLPENNMTASSLKKILDKEFGLDSDLKVPYGGRKIKAGTKISFRNFMYFCYQDQSAIVSPEYLYNKPGDLKVVERIERTFRMAIGIVDAEGAIASERLERLRLEKLSLERRSEIIGKRKLEFQEDIDSLQDEAVSLGLLDKASDYATLEELEKVARLPAKYFDHVDEKINKLELKELRIRRELQKFKSFNEGYVKYQKLLKSSDDSIAPVLVLLERYEEILPGTEASKLLLALEAELKNVKASWKERNKSLLLVDVLDEVKSLEKELQEISTDRKRLAELSERLSTPEEIYRYQGRLDAKLDLYSNKASPLDFSEKLAEINFELSKLSDIVGRIETKREFIMGELNQKINLHLSRLRLKGYEDSKAVFVESEKAINLVVDSKGRVEKMVDIGSASNYLYIHLSFFMALHEVARNNNVPWMPRFLILDQVSTPYAGENSDDVESLNLALREIDRFVEDMKKKGGIQVILMEHISEESWLKLGLDNFKLVDRELVEGYGLIN